MFQVDISLNLDQLKEEIDFLKRTWSLKRTPSALPCRSDAVLRKKTGTRKSGPLGQRSESVKLLLDWADAVCAFYNKDVRVARLVLARYLSKFRFKSIQLEINSFFFLRLLNSSVYTYKQTFPQASEDVIITGGVI